MAFCIGNMMEAKHFLFFLLTTFSLATATTNSKHYIVYMGHHSHHSSESAITANHEILASVKGSYEEAKDAVRHHYTKSFRGFSAMLTPHQARKLAERDSVVSVFESRTRRSHTTRSWRFLGVGYGEEHNRVQMNISTDIIVGIIDSGIWPDSKSFNDYGLGPVPKRFTGECITGQNFTSSNCNRKIVGARFYSAGYEAENGPLESFNLTFFRSARDNDGHGTHIASTIAGAMVSNASFFGMGEGTARGGAPGARLAIYKACWFDLCSDADILAAMDDAIHDGVDIFSLSFGADPPQPIYFEDVVSIGTFHAFQKGVFISASAGNSFLPSTAANVAPWILTVAASTIDRDLHTYLQLGNSIVIKGISANPSTLERYYSLIAGSAAAAPGISPENASFCKPSTLDPKLITGKVVVCKLEVVSDSRRAKGAIVKQGGGVGLILIDPFANDVAFEFEIPGVVISQEAKELQSYMTKEKNPVAKIFRTTTVLFTKPAPKIASFSSMGPNSITPDIIKPDIAAPGVNILAAWSPVATDISAGKSVDYNIISGTSMACPHASAIAAIIKSHHPSWSPAAIKSAIMTTATSLDNTQSQIIRNPKGTLASPFDYGSGQINPVAAIDPGLVYDFDQNDIIAFLCSIGGSPAQLKNVTGEVVHCNSTLAAPYDLNYPSIGVSKMNGAISVQRRVTYYGNGPTVYNAEVNYPDGVNVSVTPKMLSFARTGEIKAFTVTFTPYRTSNGNFVFGALVWSNGIHKVKSPIGLNVLSL
ncbi:subtilisin-like protease SBT5.3 [Ipomoea triloba]|uniref:subtilisin-like protease SBT5.3 n=1 Tax=Ipomoea triloba TaxID=35885 RepID=UPI00125CF645|nr:subtilisin-like protease SBT5.3 [Ipomoea triloba]